MCLLRKRLHPPTNPGGAGVDLMRSFVVDIDGHIRIRRTYLMLITSTDVT